MGLKSKLKKKILAFHNPAFKILGGPEDFSFPKS